ncbi:hypothetical protein CDIK_2274 [Cucumispora dikerogammari]|nr:hypothetical protein CDIK_2274 [Cucumispora dikerogammari]
MIPCLYTTQRTKKVKKWFDGYLMHNNNKKSVLFDYEHKVIMKFNLKEIAEEIIAGMYLINVDQTVYTEDLKQTKITKNNAPVVSSIQKEMEDTVSLPAVGVSNEVKKTSFKVPIPGLNENSNKSKRDYFSVPIPARGLNKNINTEGLDIIRIPSDNIKRIPTLKEVGGVIQKRARNIMSCLNEYMKLMKLEGSAASEDKTYVEVLYKQISVFVNKHEEILQQKVSEVVCEKEQIRPNLKEDMPGCDVNISEIVKKANYKKTPCLIKPSDSEIIPEPILQDQLETNKGVSVIKPEGRSNNELFDILDD